MVSGVTPRISRKPETVTFSLGTKKETEGLSSHFQVLLNGPQFTSALHRIFPRGIFEPNPADFGNCCIKLRRVEGSLGAGCSESLPRHLGGSFKKCPLLCIG